MSEKKGIMDLAKKLAYKFLALQYFQIMEISKDLELLEDGDGELEDCELHEKIFERAKMKNKLNELWDAVINKSEG